MWPFRCGRSGVDVLVVAVLDCGRYDWHSSTVARNIFSPPTPDFRKEGESREWGVKKCCERLCIHLTEAVRADLWATSRSRTGDFY